MDANEKLVRESWTHLGVYGYGGKTRYVYLADIQEQFIDANGPAVWAAAAEFTSQHKQKVEELNYEISLQIAILTGFDSTPVASRNPHYHDADRDAINRTITRLQAIRADLTLGMKE